MTPTPAIPAHRISFNADQAVQTAHWVLTMEKKMAEALHDRIDQTFLSVCQLLLGCTGKIILMGMGKSGHVARKLAATLASTGSPAFFLHPAEAGHGDMGMVTAGDVIWALSNSGESAEILQLVPAIHALGVPLVAMTAAAHSSLAQKSQYHLHVPVHQEACPMGLAPTASTTAMLMLGDAVAMVLSQSRSFTATDFAKRHPAGALGRKLLLRIQDIMRQGDQIPQVAVTANMAEALLEVTTKGMGMTAVMYPDQTLAGVFTDGDLRRSFAQLQDPHTTQVQSVMTSPCRTCSPELLASDALHMMQTYAINGLLVTDARRHVVGAVSMHDLLRAHVIA